jgi:hypothetical protein
MKLSNANVGDILSFEYQGENDYASKNRLAKVKEVDSDGVLTMDLENNNSIKRFKDSRAKDVVVAELHDTLVADHNIERITYNTGIKKLVVVRKAHEPEVSFEFYTNGNMLSKWKNHQGKVLDVEFTSKKVSVVEIVTNLAKHFGVAVK